MIDHIGIQVSDFEKSVAFYTEALAPLGYTLIKQFPPMAAGFGIGGKPDFWVGTAPGTLGVHVAILAKSRDAVRAFHEAALAAGGKDNGAPGLRPHYHENYYGAFIIDPDGHNIEAVCHEAYLG